MSKILVSPGYGAGWSTWLSDPRVLVYQPIIDHLEAGGSLTGNHPLLEQMAKDLDLDSPYYGGVADLMVVDTKGLPFQVREYDGSETVHYLASTRWWVAGAGEIFSAPAVLDEGGE